MQICKSTATAFSSVNEEGLPITEYLPEDHEGREIYGLVTNPTPDKGRALGRVLKERGEAQ